VEAQACGIPRVSLLWSFQPRMVPAITEAATILLRISAKEGLSPRDDGAFTGTVVVSVFVTVAVVVSVTVRDSVSVTVIVSCPALVDLAVPVAACVTVMVSQAMRVAGLVFV
jgi:hypothetical protein